MGHTRFFVFLSLTLCLVASVCANAYVSVSVAEKAVGDVKKGSEEAVKSAKSQLSEAKSSLNRMMFYSAGAKRAAFFAESAARRSAAAAAIAKKSRDAQEIVKKFYTNGIGVAQNAVFRMEQLLAEAEKLKAKSDMKIVRNGHSRGDYTNTKNKATALLTEVNELKWKIRDALEFLGDTYSIRYNMEKFSEVAQMEKQHVDTFVAVTKIEAMLRDTDATIQKIEQKRDEANDSVKEMEKLNQNITADSVSHTNTLYTNAEGVLIYSSEAINKVKKAMWKVKESADAALAKFVDEFDLDEAQKEAKKANSFVKDVAKKASGIANVLRSAEIAAKNSEYGKK